MSAATLYRWKKQALIDAGRKPGAKSYEPDELARARKRINEAPLVNDTLTSMAAASQTTTPTTI